MLPNDQQHSDTTRKVIGTTAAVAGVLGAASSLNSIHQAIKHPPPAGSFLGKKGVIGLAALSIGLDAATIAAGHMLSKKSNSPGDNS